MSESDIVKRLLELVVVETELACECDCPPEATANYQYAKTCEEAADEITRLRAENEKLRAALEEIDSISVHSGGDIHGIHPSAWEVAFKQAQDVARAALEEKP